MSRLFLLDGTALAYRSHHALSRSGLSAPDGRPTAAVFGFTNTLLRILECESPDLVAVALDAKGPTFRHRRYAEYKATREKAPEEMIAQLEDMRRVVRALGIALFEVPGYEADDVIGTLTREGEAAGHEVLIVTGDKDFMQLVSPKVRLYNVFKRDVELVIEDEAAVREKFGTTPERVPDVLAIMGDSSDNVPGVKGIGDKGASKLIAEHGSVAELLAALEGIEGRPRKLIEEHREMLELSLELVRIDTRVPLDPGLESVGPPAPDSRALVEVFSELGFQSLMGRVEVGRQAEEERDYHLVRDEAALEAMIQELRAAGAFAVDTETTSLFPLQAELVGISFSAAPGRAFYVPFNLQPAVLPGGREALLERLEPLLCDPALDRTGQNYKYDALVFAGQGIRVPPPDFDTMVASFCVHGSTRGHGLDELALSYFGLKKIPTVELIGRGAKQITMDFVDVEQVAEYACEDADVTFRLREKLERELAESGSEALFRDLEMPLVPVLTAMERRGIRVDTALLARLGEAMEGEIAAAEEEVHRLAGRPFKLRSHKELGQVLFEELRIQEAAGVKRPRRTKTGWATDHETLVSSYGEAEIVRQLLEYRQLTKLKSTYVDSLPGFVNPATGRIHCSFSQVSAATGRLASSDPNLQNIPVRTARGRRLREAFIPREADQAGEWVLLAADYSQVELRIMAHLAGDELMVRAFEEGRDIHASTAAVVFGVAEEEVDREMRSRAKAINFGLLYGMGANRLARETGMSLAEARGFIERYFEAFPRVRGWKEQVLEHARAEGYVETLLGRRRPIPEINSKNPRARAMAENAAVNTPVQGSAADIIKRAMIALEERLADSELAGRMLLQVHDELLLEVPRSQVDETVPIVRECMESAVTLDLPLAVDFGWGASWLEAH